MMLYDVGPHEGRAHPEVRLNKAGYPIPSNFIPHVPPNQNSANNFVRGFVEFGKDEKTLDPSIKSCVIDTQLHLLCMYQFRLDDMGSQVRSDWAKENNEMFANLK